MIVVKLSNKINYQIAYWITQSYESLIIKALRSGLAKTDIKKIKRHSNNFHLPTFRTIILFKVKLRLMILDSISRIIFGKKNLKESKYKVLNQYEVMNSCHWNPAFLRHPKEVNLNKYDKYQLEVHIIPSPYGFKWDNPQSIFISLRNYFSLKYKHKIGHAFIVIKQNGKNIIATGMTGETNYQIFYDLIFRKRGINFLFQMFRGRLEDAKFVLGDIEHHQKINKIRSLKFDITEEQFKCSLNYLHLWCEDGHYKRYGLTLDPIKDKGAGCVSFAISFLRQLDLINQDQLSKWTRKVQIPKYLISNSHNKIGLISLAIKLIYTKQWRKQGETFHQIEFLDPDLIYHSLENDKLNF